MMDPFESFCFLVENPDQLSLRAERSKADSAVRSLLGIIGEHETKLNGLIDPAARRYEQEEIEYFTERLEEAMRDRDEMYGN